MKQKTLTICTMPKIANPSSVSISHDFSNMAGPSEMMINSKSMACSIKSIFKAILVFFFKSDMMF